MKTNSKLIIKSVLAAMLLFVIQVITFVQNKAEPAPLEIPPEISGSVDAYMFSYLLITGKVKTTVNRLLKPPGG